MPSRSRKIRLGIFVLILSAVFIAIVAVIGTKQLFKKRDIYFVSYKNISVSGLEKGSPVKYLGINVGSVRDIRIDPDDVNRIIVEVGLKPRTPVKQDARADIASISITGLKIIEIRGGSNEAPLLQPGEYIPAGSSITEAITGKAEIIAEKLELVLNNLTRFTKPENLDKVFRLIDDMDSTAVGLYAILAENRESLHSTISRSRTVIARIDSTSRLLHESVGEFHALRASDRLAGILVNFDDASTKLKEANLAELIWRFSQVIESTNRLLLSMENDLQRGSQDFSISMQRLKATLENLNETSRLVNEDPSILIRGTQFENIPDNDLDR